MGAASAGGACGFLGLLSATKIKQLPINLTQPNSTAPFVIPKGTVITNGSLEFDALHVYQQKYLWW